MAGVVAERGLEQQTVFLVLPGQGKKARPSRLYDKTFSHSFRDGA
jgi:precorrin-4 methylase